MLDCWSVVCIGPHDEDIYHERCIQKFMRGMPGKNYDPRVAIVCSKQTCAQGIGSVSSNCEQRANMRTRDSVMVPGVWLQGCGTITSHGKRECRCPGFARNKGGATHVLTESSHNLMGGHMPCQQLRYSMTWGSSQIMFQLR
jgi:hypothetical protein